MKLSSFIRDNIEQILQEWEAFARTLLPASKDMTVEQLRNHARQLLVSIANDLDTTQSKSEQKEKSQGRGPHATVDSAAQIHAGMRAESGLSLDQMVSERKLPRQVDSFKLEIPLRANARGNVLAAGFPAHRVV